MNWKSYRDFPLKEGDYVIFNYASSEETAAHLNTELISKSAGKYEIIKADLSNTSGVAAFADEILKNHSSIAV